MAMEFEKFAISRSWLYEDFSWQRKANNFQRPTLDKILNGSIDNKKVTFVITIRQKILACLDSFQSSRSLSFLKLSPKTDSCGYIILRMPPNRLSMNKKAQKQYGFAYGCS